MTSIRKSNNVSASMPSPMALVRGERSVFQLLGLVFKGVGEGQDVSGFAVEIFRLADGIGDCCGQLAVRFRDHEGDGIDRGIDRRPDCVGRPRRRGRCKSLPRQRPASRTRRYVRPEYGSASHWAWGRFRVTASIWNSVVTWAGSLLPAAYRLRTFSAFSTTAPSGSGSV